MLTTIAAIAGLIFGFTAFVLDTWWGMADGKVKPDELVKNWAIECELELHELEADPMSGKVVLIADREWKDLNDEVRNIRRLEAPPVKDDGVFELEVLSDGTKLYRRKKKPATT